MIKFPGSPRGAGVIDLSTVVSSLKKELEPDGKFKVYNLKSLEYQRKALLNYFKALSWFYFEKNIWTVKTTNPFFINAGFNAAIEHFLLSVMPKCMEMGSFEIDTIKTILNLQSTKLITRNDIKSMDGKGARKKVREFLEEAMISDLPKENELRF